MSFAQSFWTEDYHLGHEVLFDELYEGVKENEDFIALFTKRMDLELKYGTELENGPQTAKLLSRRHANDDYVSTVKNAFSAINSNLARQGQYHKEIAENIRELVLRPFTKWCSEHEQRVGYLEKEISEKYKQYSANKISLEKLLKKYFNKCRIVEDFRGHYTEAELEEAASENVDESGIAESGRSDAADSHEKTYVFGGAEFSQRTTRELLTQLLQNIELTSHKVAILGTYYNVSTGSTITQWLLDNMPELRGSIAKAEAFGQDLITHGFIRMIASMSANKNFINSSQFHYQWKPAVFELTKLSEFDLSKQAQNAKYDPIAALGSRTNQFSTYIEDMKQAIGVAAVDFNDKSQYAKLTKEVQILDAQYFEATKVLDAVRCEYEETVMDHMSFMQKCEFDRLKAVKKVTFDFIAAFSNKVGSLKHSCEKLLLVEETISPSSDLKFLIENYGTGKFLPHVTLYDNYYDSNIRQTFGVDLNVKARLDKKAVPVIIQAALSCLDSIYPELENDEERVDLWTKPVHLSEIHRLRLQLNELGDAQQISEVLMKSDPTLVTNVLKLYFMELPDSIVLHTFFDLIKTLYQSYPVGSGEDASDKSRITGLQNTLVELPVCNLATLDALLMHLNRLVQIIGSKNAELGEMLQARLCKEFGGLVLRPKPGTAEAEGKSVHAFNQATEILQRNFIADLFGNKEVIFGELRRRNSKKPTRDSSTKSELGRSAPLKLKVSQSSKLRLQSKMKSAVSNASDKAKLSETPAEEKTEESSVASQLSSDAVPYGPSTPPPPATPSKSTVGSSLKRSTSPNKKKLNAYLSKGSISPETSSKLANTNSEYTSANTSQTELSHISEGKSVNDLSGTRDRQGKTGSPTPKLRKRVEEDNVIVVD